MFFLLLITSVFASKSFFHQSPLDSIITNFEILKLPLLIFYAFIFEKEKIEVEQIKKTILVFVCIEIVVEIIFKGHDKASLTAGEGILNADKLPKNFIRFGVYYFFALFIRKGKFLYGFISLFLLFFPNVVTDFQRGYFAIALFVMSMTFLFFKKKTSSVNTTLIIITLTALLLMLILTLNFSNAFLDKVEAKYSSVLSGISKGKGEDVSVNYRFFELKVGADFFRKSPVIGVGKLIGATTEKVVGKPYYPSDIGIMGIMATFGILGLVVYTYLFFQGSKSYFSILKKSKIYTAFTIGLACYGIHLALESLQTGGIMFHPVLFAFVCLLLIYSKRSDELQTFPANDSEVLLFNPDSTKNTIANS